MKQFYSKVLLSIFSVIFLFSCQNDDADSPVQQAKVLFSVNYGSSHTGDIKGYLAAYTPEGELLNYGSLGDSLKWDLKAKYNGDKIDILYFEVVNGMQVQHIKNISVGQTFTNLRNIFLYQETDRKTFKFKVEDFGKREGNGNVENGFSSTAYLIHSGYATFNPLTWSKIENGYTYADITFTKGNDIEEKEYGAELLLFEKNTNKPYVKYLDLKMLTQNYTSNDVITLNKSDFSPAEIKTVQVDANNVPYENMFLYTYNIQADRRNIIRSFNHIIEGNKIWYVSSNDEIPINYWRLVYSAKTGNTSYVAESNKKEVPSLVNVKELSGHSITKNGDKFSFKHGAVFPDKKLLRTFVSFYKYRYSANSITYIWNFDSTESTGTLNLKPFKFPAGLLDKFSNIKQTDQREWETGDYGQVYDTRSSTNVMLNYLNDILLWKTNVYTVNEYTFETYSIKL
ncbi:hypothetical protein ASE40_15000 [Flavobacterium sp. Root935]|uniref:hypothetical protein n=1 Tax=Flavobacterium sp. Root935 TaxID=1736610 RepID=UPI00070AA52A|nr:hypothetical protein [Flavobacterium sp. Root935]KRD57671.1 hypothetical protein ASE40_15000 [Flavobacterium sp. Root935]